MVYFVYMLCSLMSLGVAIVLLRAYRSNRTRLLLWSSLCFVGIAVNNILLSIDFSLGPNYDLTTVRAFSSLIAMFVLLYGLIWDTV
ncbi:DUF5985 family protein [Bdellovibrio sp. 22V]|uniref:DUF5985 family protein n=1 Tax=Bdellovibrio TaxID=958 RepID=UPI002542863C|nr:DUF5985 family protein [Bdellovibrio sp. 22V]WII72381.1 DUF5985 family protein [Bdellovibrio sp. 22V]